MCRSAEYRAWLDECEKVIRAARIAPVRGSYKLLIRARRPDNRRRDIDNIGGKAVNDMLQKAGIVEDDCMCEMIICKWVNYGPDTSVKITPTRGHHELQGRTASALQSGQKADAAKRDTAKVQAVKMMAEEIANSPKLPPIPGLVLNEIGAIRWMRVLHAVARQHGIGADEILSHSRQRHVVVARFEVFYRLRIDLGMSYKKIADLMKKDHTTILYGVHKVRKHLLDHSSEVSESGMLRFGKHSAECSTHKAPLMSAV